MDPTSQFNVPTIIDVPELIVTNEDVDYDDSGHFVGSGGASGSFGGNGILMNKLQFLSSALSYAIGLGNIWRFPYLCYKHAGGSFLLAYTLILIIVGLPLLMMEMAFGQYANEGPITIWRISPAFEGIGYAMCLVSTTIALYYSIINTWILHYLLASITFGPLPWTTCDNTWNGEHCIYKPDKIQRGSNNCTNTMTVSNKTLETKTTSNSNNHINTTSTILDNAIMATNSSLTSADDIFSVPGNCTMIGDSSSFDKVLKVSDEIELPANEYFHNNVLDLGESASHLGGINWSLVFGSIIIWSSVFIILLKNLHRPLTSNRHLALLSLLVPYLALFALFTRSITLPGASLGSDYLITVEWERFQYIDIWADATTQLFFSMSPCWGGIITLANMNKFHENFHANTILIVLVNYFTSLIMALIMFGTIGYMSSYSGVALNEVVDSGVGFMFQVLPEALAQFPLVRINSALLFAIILFLGYSSQLTVIETVITTIIDTWPHKLRYRRPLVLMILCASMFLIGSIFLSFQNGFYLVQGILDKFVGTITAMLIGILELIAIAWVYGMDNFMQDIDDMISVHRNLFPTRRYWYFMWRYLAPSVLFAILLFCLTDLQATHYRKVLIGPWTDKIGWTLTIVCLSVIPIIAFIRFMLAPQGSFVDKISYLCRPSEDWAPSSYVSGPKLLNRHKMLDDDSDMILDDCSGRMRTFGDHSQASSRDRDDALSQYMDDTIIVSSSAATVRGGGGCGGAMGGRSSNKKIDSNTHDNGVGTVYGRGFRLAPNGSFKNRPLNLDEGDDDHDGEDLEEEDDDDDDDDDLNNLRVVNGKANYIIPEEEEDTDTGLITTSETNV